MKKKFFIGLFILAIAGLGVYAHLALNHKTSECTKQSNLQAPIEIPATGIKQVSGDLQIKKPAAIMFYVDWCTYCKRFMPIFGEAAAKYNKKFDFLVVNCEHPENEQLVKEHNIAGFPSIFINDKDLDFEYQVSYASTVDVQSFGKELEKHLKLRSKLKK